MGVIFCKLYRWFCVKILKILYLFVANFDRLTWLPGQGVLKNISRLSFWWAKKAFKINFSQHVKTRRNVLSNHSFVHVQCIYIRHLIVFPKGTIQDNNKRNNIHLYIEYISKCQARVNAVFFYCVDFFLNACQTRKDFFFFLYKNLSGPV